MQDTDCDPNNFKMFINDLKFKIGYMKYVDNTTAYIFLVINADNMSLHLAADDRVR